MPPERRKNRRGPSAASGFTLIETLAAGIILAMAVAVVGTSLSHAYAALSEAADERRAAALLDNLLTRIDLIGPSRVASEGPHDGTFDGADARFSWSAEIRNRPQGHLYDVTVTISWSSIGQEKSIRLETYLTDPPGWRDATLRWRDL